VSWFIGYLVLVVIIGWCDWGVGITIEEGVFFWLVMNGGKVVN